MSGSVGEGVEVNEVVLTEIIITIVHIPTQRVPLMATIVHCTEAVGVVLHKVAVFCVATKIRPMSGQVIVGLG